MWKPIASGQVVKPQLLMLSGCMLPYSTHAARHDAELFGLQSRAALCEKDSSKSPAGGSAFSQEAPAPIGFNLLPRKVEAPSSPLVPPGIASVRTRLARSKSVYRQW